MAAWPGKVGQGMDASFRAAAAQYRQAAPKLTHSQRVCRLYRNALKTQNSWAVDRQVFIAEADKMRAEFDKHAQLAATSVEARNLLERGEEKLFQESHPRPLHCGIPAGGSLYMRNAPCLSPCAATAISRKARAHARNPDLTRVVEGSRRAVVVLVDQHRRAPLAKLITLTPGEHRLRSPTRANRANPSSCAALSMIGRPRRHRTPSQYNIPKPTSSRNFPMSACISEALSLVLVDLFCACSFSVSH